MNSEKHAAEGEKKNVPTVTAAQKILAKLRSGFVRNRHGGGGAISASARAEVPPLRPGLRDRLCGWRAVGSRALRELAWAGTAFLAVRASPAFGARPFCFALLCAAPDHVPSLLLGTVAAAFFVGSGGELVAASALCAVGLRILVRCLIEPPADGRFFASMFRESVYLRMATAAVAAFGAGFGMLVRGDFYIYDLWNTVLSTVTSPVGVLIFLPLFPGNAEQLPPQTERAGRVMRALARFSLLPMFTLALRGVTWMGLAPVHAVVTVAVLLCVRRHGAAAGAVAGILCGWIVGWRFAVLYGAAGVLAGLLIHISVIAAGTAVTVCGAVLCSLLRVRGSFLAVFPPELVGAGVFCLICRVEDGLRTDGAAALPARGAEAAYSLDEGGEVPIGRRIGEMSDAFGKIADIYAEFSRSQARPGMPELREICDGVCDIYCPGCPRRAVCWDAEYSATLERICRVCVSLYENGKVDPELTEEARRAGCDCAAEMAEAINFGAGSLWRRRLSDCRIEILSHDTRAVSKVLSEALAGDRKNKTPDRRREAAVREVFDACGVRYSGLCVTGTRCLRIFASEADFHNVTESAEEIRLRLEAATGHRLSAMTLTPVCDEREGREGERSFSLELHTRRRYGVTFAAARSAARGRESDACGDMVCCVNSAPGGEEYFYAVLCDGMGTGSGAAAAAKVCCDLLRRMLGADMSVEAAIEMLNSLLRSSIGERSVGLDLLRIDLIDGRATIWKSGAAASYLRRGKNIGKIEAHTVPVGILNDARAEKKDFRLTAGDAVLLTSDGINVDPAPAPGENAEGAAGTDGETDWLSALLRNFDPSGESAESAQQAANDAVRCAVRHARLVGSRDDISAAMIVIHDCE